MPRPTSAQTPIASSRLRSSLTKPHIRKMPYIISLFSNTKKIRAGREVLEQARDTRRRIHSVAALAHASADVATPLLLSATLKVCMDEHSFESFLQALSLLKLVHIKSSVGHLTRIFRSFKGHRIVDVLSWCHHAMLVQISMFRS